jgi:hypothetical protein
VAERCHAAKLPYGGSLRAASGVKTSSHVKVFLTFTFTEYGTVLTTILPILFLYLNTVIVTAGAFEP